MEVVTMARLALFRSSGIIWLSSIGFFGCNTSLPQGSSTYSNVLSNKDEQQISMANGLLIVNKQPFSGRLFSLFPGSRDTVEIASYREGREHGEWVIFYPSGKIKEKRFFEDGQKTGEYAAWWENGNRQLHYFFEADEYEGTCKEWNVDGKLVKVLNYKKGHEEGHQQWWYDNGKVKANYVIQDGRRFGLLGTKNCVNVSDSIFGR